MQVSTLKFVFESLRLHGSRYPFSIVLVWTIGENVYKISVFKRKRISVDGALVKPAAHERRQLSKLPGKAVCELFRLVCCGVFLRISIKKSESKISDIFDIFGLER